MRRALLFNPENDLALAADTLRYTPPPAAAALSRAGALLPLWWSGPDDVIMAPESDAAAAAGLCSRYGLDGKTGVTEDFSSAGVCCPWGWSRHTRWRYESAGVRREALPSDEWLEHHRLLSHRRVSVSISSEIGIPEDLLPVEAFSRQDALGAISRFDGQAFVKLPWSSSGRGVFDVRRLDSSTLTRYIDGFIRRQGSIMVERARRKAKDFAMLFRCSGGTAAFVAMSGFHTDAAGRYLGNLIASDETIIGRLGEDPRAWADPLARALTSVIAPYYDGWVGIDMMTEENPSGGLEIVPCVEANVRMTMGVVARFIYDRLGMDMLLSVSRDPAAGSGQIDLSPVSAPAGMHIIASPLR